MRRTGLLLITVTLAVAVAGGAALAVTPVGGALGTAQAGATTTARGPDAALDRALKELVAMPGGPPGVIAVVQRGQSREVHTFGVANLRTERRMSVNDRMRIASAAKAFSGAVALSLVSNTDELSLDDTIGERCLTCGSRPPPTGRRLPSGSYSTTPAACRTTRVKPSGPRLWIDSGTPTRRRNCSLTPTT